MYTLFTLNNGLRVVIEKIDYINSVSVGLWIENGSRNEDKENNGISHFIEHMLFKGTENRTSKNIVECIENVGGQINAFTSKEATCFYVKALDSHLTLALDLLSDMLFNSKFNTDDIEKEKNIVIEEINMNEDTPEELLMDIHSSIMWKNDSLTLPILGTIKNVKSFTRKQLIKYLDEHYIPENSVISITGNVNFDIVKKIIDEYFGHWNSTNKKITSYSCPKIHNAYTYKNKNIEQLHISAALEGLKLGSNDQYTLMLLNNILGGSASSILFQKIREDMGMCYSIYSYVSPFVNTGTVNIYTALNPDCAVDALYYINEEIIKFTKTHINNEKLITAKEQLKGNFILALESTSSRMFRNGRIALFLNKTSSPNNIIKKIDEISHETIIDVMNKTFSKGIKNAAFLGNNIQYENLTNALLENTTAYINNKKTNI